MITGNELAFPAEFQDNQNSFKPEFHCGLTIRQHFAASVSFSENDMFTKKEDNENFMGTTMPLPSTDPLAYLRYWAEFESKVRLIKADALIAELNKTETP